MAGKHFYTYLLLLLFSSSVYAQEQLVITKKATMNMELTRYIAAHPGSPEMTNILVQGDVNAIKTLAQNNGGIFKFTLSNIVAVRMPLNRISLLMASPSVKRIEAMQGKGMQMDDQVDVNCDITPVKQGARPFTKGYDGKGVVVGIIDDGIDISHPDFKDSLGNTRIKYLWSQNSTTGGATPLLGYGQEWDSTAINTSCPYVETSAEFGHGSNVAGIAAGNGLAVNNYYGVATKSDIIAIDLNMGNNFLNNLVDAVNYIYTKAALLGEPCVINVSLGTYDGSHDGHDLPAKMIDNLITAQNGRALVCAAGNAGSISLHLGYNVQPDSSFTWFKYSPILNQVYFEVWGNKKDMANMQFALGADHVTPYSFRGRTPYYNMLSSFTNINTGVDSVSYALTNNSNVIGNVKIYAEAQDSSYHLYVHVYTDSTAYYWRFITNGTGYFDLWAKGQTFTSTVSYTNTSDMVRANLPSSSTFPDIARYKLPDQTQNIVSSFTCSDKTIAVANYNNRRSWLDVDTLLQTPVSCIAGNSIDTAAGAISSTSSKGPTRDGRNKPDISAPGNYVYGSGLLSLMPTFIGAAPCKVGEGGMHILNSGTSMSSPVVAGIVALFLQREPNASWLDIKNAILTTARHDVFTTNNLPNASWGYGKVDAYAMLTAYGCMDNKAVNYDSLATTDDGNCNYATIVSTINQAAMLNSYPNPFNGSTNFQYAVNNQQGNNYIVITDMLGKQLTAILLVGQQGNVSFDATTLQSGTYFYSLVTNGKTVATKKMVIY